MENTDTPTDRGAKRRRLTKEERAEHVSAWKRSGSSAQIYAQEHGVGPASLYAWSRQQGGVEGKGTARTGASPFVPVRLSGGSSFGGGSARVTLKAPGLECVIEGAGDASAFATLAGAIKREIFGV